MAMNATTQRRHEAIKFAVALEKDKPADQRNLSPDHIIEVAEKFDVWMRTFKG